MTTTTQTSTNTHTFPTTLNVVHCARCGLAFGITADFEKRRRDDHAGFTCPSGHSNVYNGATDEDRLRTRLRLAEQSEEFYRNEATYQRRSAAAQKGLRTRVLNLIAKGVCPVAGCRRNFGDVRGHMATEHPDFHTPGDDS